MVTDAEDRTGPSVDTGDNGVLRIGCLDLLVFSLSRSQFTYERKGL